MTASFVVALAAGTAGHGEGAGGQSRTMSPNIEEAQRDLADQVMALPGVVGVAIGKCDGEPCIKVLVAAGAAELAAKIPARFKGHRVVIDETGEIRAPRPLRDPPASPKRP